VSQFILVASPVVENFPDYIQLKNVSNVQLFSEVAKSVFPDFDSQKVFTVGSAEKDFDQIFVDAQRDLIMGSSFEVTSLYKLLLVTLQNSNGIALWYGSDYSDLKKVDTYESFLNEVHGGLCESSVEAYVLFLRRNVIARL
jgi:hypothetical protein